MIHIPYRNLGEVYAVKTASTANGVTTTLLDQKGYDPRGRLIREWHSINGGTPVLVRNTTYDEIERMSQNALGNGVVASAFTYDIQDRLRKINYPANLGTKPFALELQYNAPNVTGATAQYSGNISAARWKHLSSSEQTYYYNYDSYSRLTAGIHGGGNSEQSIGYDSNGNRLTSLTKDGTSYSYAYDANGNTTTDGLRAMTLTYNQLNLPKSVTKGTDNLEYVYDARGNKLAIKVNGIVDKYYTGEIVYTSGRAVDYILTPEGMARPSGGTFAYQYNLTDHLVSVRAVVNQNGTVDQATDYYPFGMAFSTNNLTKNNYLYNGKELQNQTLSSTFFGMYDYGARYYDPAIGRWNSVDPMVEKYYNISSYGYCYGNPLRFIDPDGRDIVITGELNQEALKQLQNKVRGNITISMDDNGKLSFTQNRDKNLRGDAKRLAGIINDNSITVNLKTTAGDKTSMGNLFVGGAFMGNTVTKDASGNVTAITANQEINPNVLGVADDHTKTSGKMIMHEATEAYQGALISKRQGVSSGPSNKVGSVYKEAHNKATPQTPVYQTMYDRSGNKTQDIQQAVRAEWSVINSIGVTKAIQTFK